ncbi:MAG: hypothetical protein CMM29_05415 [Rhodospirillaceae bacterium]|nr:hypothetical protein [Rhodospirillaceae bacterium]
MVNIELNSITDNPIVLKDGDIVSGGNFHGQPLAIPIDYNVIAASELGNISDRRIYSLALPSRKPQPIVKSIKLQSQSEPIIQTQIDYDKITPARNLVKYESVTTHRKAAQTTYNKIKGRKTPGKHEKIKSNKDNSLKLIYNPAPRYPRIARKEGKEGLVTINAIISSKGLVTTASIKKSSGFPILDRAALKAVRKWVFKPKLKFNGNSNSSVDVPIQFKLTKS